MRWVSTRLFRTFSLAIVLAATTLGCPRNNDTQAGETGDSEQASPDYFDVHGYTFRYYLGVRDGQLTHDYYSNGVDTYSYLSWYFVDGEFDSLLGQAQTNEEYQAVWDEHACEMVFALESTDAAHDEQAWFDWDLQLEPTENRCLVDPDLFGDNALDWVMDMDWAVAIGPLDEDLWEALDESYESYQPYLMGVQTYWSGQPVPDVPYDHHGVVFAYPFGEHYEVDYDDRIAVDGMHSKQDGYFYCANLYNWTLRDLE